MTTEKIRVFAFLALFITLFLATLASAVSPLPVAMGTTANFGVLAGTAVTNTGPTIVGKNLGLSPNNNSSITGFFVIDSGPGIVNGTIHAANSIAGQAKLDLVTAYNDAASRSAGVVIIPSGELGGLTLVPGLYRSGMSSFAISSGDLTLDAQGDANAVFIFQMPSSSLTTTSGQKVVLKGNANPCNVFWQVGSSATIGTNSTFKGNILALTSITVTTGANVDGRVLARNGAVTLDSNTVFQSCANTTLTNSTSVNATNVANTTAPNTTNVSNSNQTGNQTSGSSCYSWLKDVPATCEGGIITQNTDLVTYDNCRHVTCVKGKKFLEILACEKPDEINPTYFEMYKRGNRGTEIKICLGNACIQKNGFAKQQFPVCTGVNQTIVNTTTSPCEPKSSVVNLQSVCKKKLNQTTNTTVNQTSSNQTSAPVNATLTQINQTNETSVMLSIAPWYPQGRNYVFNCIADGFTPVSYDWVFGDGHKNLNYNQNNVYHSYAKDSYAKGNYTVTCTAKNLQVSQMGTITLKI